MDDEDGLMASRTYDRYMLVIGLGRNRKLVRLTDSERCAHVLGVLALAAQAPRRGYLLVSEGVEVGPEEIASEAGGGVTVKVARSALEKLKRVGVLEHDDEAGAWFVHDWWEINPDPRSDPSNAERQQRYRDRKRNGSNGEDTVTHNGESNAARNGSVTDVTAEVTNSPPPPPPPGPPSSPAPPHEGEGEASPAGGAARKRARRQVDQTQRPDDFPDDLVGAGQAVLRVLHDIWDHRGGYEPQARGVGLAIMRNVKADHVRIARDLEHYMTAGKGQRSPCGDIAKRYGDWVADAPLGAAAVPGVSDLDRKRLDALSRVIAKENGVQP